MVFMMKFPLFFGTPSYFLDTVNQIRSKLNVKDTTISCQLILNTTLKNRFVSVIMVSRTDVRVLMGFDCTLRLLRSISCRCWWSLSSFSSSSAMVLSCFAFSLARCFAFSSSSARVCARSAARSSNTYNQQYVRECWTLTVLGVTSFRLIIRLGL